jgi:hypothetical protein
MTLLPPSSVKIGNTNLKPAPFVSTSYEYNKSGQYIIGGVLIVNLDGTIVGEDIVTQMNDIGALQSTQDCVMVTIGCQGASDFLSGAGRVRSVELSQSDQPFVATYSIVIAIEALGDGPAVNPDPEFLTRNNLSERNARFIKAYFEKLSFEGNSDNLGLVDSELGLSKSYVKAQGEINVTCYGRNICGVPEYDGMKAAIALIEERAANLMSFIFSGPEAATHPLAKYSGWQKWIDTKTLEINDSGAAIWKFDLYMSFGSCAPTAWVDLNTDDKVSLESETPKKTRTIRGTIKGLSPATLNFLGNKIGPGERLANANVALGKILPKIINGNWPGLTPNLTGERNTPAPTPSSTCEEDDKEEVCYQRISSTISTSVVAGEITFSAEYADIPTCKTLGVAAIETTIDERLPSVRHQEFIVPNNLRSIIHYIGDKPHEATVTVRGTLQGCDQAKIQEIIKCVDTQFTLSSSKYNGWLVKEENKTISTYSYSRNKTFIKCG